MCNHMKISMWKSSCIFLNQNIRDSKQYGVNFEKAPFINNGPEVGNMYEVGETSQVSKRNKGWKL